MLLQLVNVCGLNEEILKNANQYINNDTIHIEDILKNIYDNKLQIENEKIEIDKNLKQVQELRKVLEKQKESINTEHTNLVQDAKLQARNIILSAKDEANEIIKDLSQMLNSNNVDLKKANKLRNRLNKSLNNSSTVEDASTNSKNSILDKNNLKVGLPVFVIPLQKEGIIASLPNRPSEVLVQIGNAKMNVKINNLAKSTSSSETNSETGVDSASRGPSKRSGSSNNSINSKVSFKKSEDFKAKNATTEINVIGLNVEEANQIIDKYLDNCTLANISTVRIVHGKGTGKLMHGIHSFLKNNQHVKSYRLGTYGEGETGVTVVTLK